jgi:hypothetical protein
MKARPFRSGVTLSRLERTAIMVAIALAFCWNLSATRKNAVHFCTGTFVEAKHLRCQRGVRACETSLDTTDAMTLGDLPLL